MPDYETTLEVVRDILVDILAVEPEEVTPDANFFHDLSGESIDVLDLQFHCEKKFEGHAIRFTDLVNKSATNSTDGGLESKFTFVDFAQFGPDAQPVDLFTVDTIVRFIQHRIETGEPVRPSSGA